MTNVVSAKDRRSAASINTYSAMESDRSNAVRMPGATNHRTGCQDRATAGCSRMIELSNSDVSVIILTKNSARTIERCVRSVRTESPGEIIAVDARSTDRTLEILTRYGVRILVDEIGSLAYSRQIGVEAARGTYVMFVDSDVVLTHGCVRRLREDLEKYAWSGIHARILSPENASYWQRGEDRNFLLYFNRVGARARIGMSAALFRRRVLLEYPFDPSFREASEDMDLCHRLARGGHALGVDNAAAYHYHRQEFSAFVTQRFLYGIGNARYALKYGGVRTLFSPLLFAFSRTAHSATADNIVPLYIELLPYWFFSGAAQFFGSIVGLSRARSKSNGPMSNAQAHSSL